MSLCHENVCHLNPVCSGSIVVNVTKGVEMLLRHLHHPLTWNIKVILNSKCLKFVSHNLLYLTTLSLLGFQCCTSICGLVHGVGYQCDILLITFV